MTARRSAPTTSSRPTPWPGVPDCRFNQSLCLSQILDDVERVDDRTVAFTLRTRLASFAAVGLGIWIESKDAVDASYGRFSANLPPVAEVGAFLDKVAIEESRPTGPDGADGKPTVDYARFRDAGEGLLRTAGLALPRESAHTTDGVFDVRAYVRDVIARIRAIDVTFTDRPIDAMAAAYPYLDFQDRPVGTGPFIFDTSTPGDGLAFVANEDYFLGAPNVKRLILPIIGSDADRTAALVDGAIDWDPRIGGAAYAPIKDDPGLKFAEYLDLSFLGLYFNLHPETNGLFLDRNLRQAVASCFDRPATATAATEGQGVAIYTEIPPISWAYPSGGLETYPLDTARARQLIEASGWKEGADGIYAKAGRRLATVVAVRAGFPERSRWLQSVSEQVRRCGIDLTYKEVPFAQILGMLEVYPHINAAAPRSGQSFDAYFGGFGVAFDPDPFALYHSSECSSAERPTTLNYICYASDAVDRLIDAGRAEFDADEAGGDLPRLRDPPVAGPAGDLRLVRHRPRGPAGDGRHDRPGRPQPRHADVGARRRAADERALGRRNRRTADRSGGRVHLGRDRRGGRTAEMARTPVAAAEVDERRDLVGADGRAAELLAELAARVEPAARRRVDRARHVAREDHPLAPKLGVGHRDGRHQRRPCRGAPGARTGRAGRPSRRSGRGT